MDYYDILLAKKLGGGGGGGSGEWTSDGIANGTEPNGDIVLGDTVVKISDQAFRKRTAITSITGKEVTTLGSECVRDCSGATGMYFRKLGMVAGYLFGNCASLVTVDLGLTSQIPILTFTGCSALRVLILRKSDNACALGGGWNANTLAGIYNNPSSSEIYVPSSLISAYQNATNWSDAYSSGVVFKAIEGSIYE